MKKLLIPSVLAGLMICVPTIQAHAVGYEPYAWDTTGETRLNSYTSSGLSISDDYLSTPYPAGLSMLLTFSGSTPSGITGSDSSYGVASAESVWEWTGGGAPADYDEVAVTQFQAAITASNGVSNIGYEASIETYALPAIPTYYHYYTNGPYTNDGPTGQQVTPNGRVGQTFLSSKIDYNVFYDCSIGSNGNSTLTSQAVNQISYILP